MTRKGEKTRLEYIIIITGIILRKAALKALYHRGRLVELNVRQDSNDPKVRKQGHAVKLWGIREEIEQTIRGKKRGEREREREG